MWCIENRHPDAVPANIEGAHRRPVIVGVGPVLPVAANVDHVARRVQVESIDRQHDAPVALDGLQAHHRFFARQVTAKKPVRPEYLHAKERRINPCRRDIFDLQTQGAAGGQI